MPEHTLYLYRVLENNSEGDPLDYGLLSALSVASAADLLRGRLGKLGLRSAVAVRFSPVHHAVNARLETGPDTTLMVLPRTRREPASSRRRL